MMLTNHPRLIARVAGVFYLIITVFALFAYLYVRPRLIIPGDMARTMANIVAQQGLYRLGLAATMIVTVSNLPLGMIFYELFKIVNPRLALLALMFIIVSTTIEAINAMNYISPLFTFTLPEYRAAFSPAELEALARGANRMFGYTFSVSLVFFGVFCVLTGTLIVMSKFLPKVLGVLMIAAGIAYWLDDFGTFLAWPDVSVVLNTGLIAENALALWLVVFGVNEAKWRAQAKAFVDASAQEMKAHP
jgi:hypothetical protein